MKARVTLFYKDSVFDPQGNTIAHSLHEMGFEKVGSVRVGRVIDIELKEQTKEEAENDIQRICEDLLANPVLESYQIQFLSAS